MSLRLTTTLCPSLASSWCWKIKRPIDFERGQMRFYPLQKCLIGAEFGPVLTDK